MANQCLDIRRVARIACRRSAIALSGWLLDDPLHSSISNISTCLPLLFLYAFSQQALKGPAARVTRNVGRGTPHRISVHPRKSDTGDVCPPAAVASFPGSKNEMD